MSATTDFVNTVSRNFVRGYAVGSENRRRKGQADVASHNYEDYVIEPEGAVEDGTVAPVTPEGQAMTSEAIPENSANNIAGSVNQATAQPMATEGAERPAFAEGGESENVNKLIAESESTPAIDEADPGYGENPVDRALQAQKKLPKVKVVDWEAAKRDKADAYMRAGMHEKAANIDQEFTDLKRRKFQEFASRALQVLETDPAKAATLLSMASQFSADGSMSTFLPTPGGQIMEVSLDEVTGKPLGEGTPVDAQTLRKFIMMNADPQKFLYTQVDNEWREERAKRADKEFALNYGQKLAEFVERNKQHLDDMGYKYTALDQQKAIAAARISADAATESGYKQTQWDKKVESLNDFISDVSDPSKFKNEFGTEYAYDLEAGVAGAGMPDMMKLRTGAESFMGHNGHNKTMSPQTATDLYLTVTTPGAIEKAQTDGRLDATKKGEPILKGRDGKWYYIPDFEAGPTPAARPAGTP